MLLIVLYGGLCIAAADITSLHQWSFMFAGNDSATNYATAPDTADNWQPITTPHSFNTGEILGTHKKGFGWYRTAIEIDPDRNSDLSLISDGVCLRCKVFIDGVFAGEDRLAYLPFRIDISPHIKKKKRVAIAIQVDNRLLQRNFPDHNANGWWIYGGLIRPVHIVQCPKKRIENAQIRTRYAGKDRFRTTVSFTFPHKAPDKVTLAIRGPEGGVLRRHIFGRGERACTLAIENVGAWSPSSPVLYDFVLTPYWGRKEGAPVCIKRGFADLTAQEDSLYFNGKPIFLRGIGRHDVIGDRGPLLTRKERAEDLAAIKAAGANMLRIAHFPQHRDIYELCDSIGLIVMDEMPAWKTYPPFLASSEGRAAAGEYMQRLIDAHGNHTSIAFWCIGNEIHSVADRVAKYVEYMADFTRNADPSRLVTYTSYYYQFDKAYRYIDVVSVNEYMGWYAGSVDMLPALLRAVRNEAPGKPIIVTEFGSSAALGLRNEEATLAGAVKSLLTKDFSEDYQALLYKEQLAMLWRCRKLVRGATVWCYNDFMEDRKKPHASILKPGVNGMGIVTVDRKKKRAFEVVEEEFRKIEKAMKEAGGIRGEIQRR